MTEWIPEREVGGFDMCNRLRWTTVLVLGVCVGGGCRNGSNKTGVLEGRPQFYVYDVPVPRNFELDTRKSEHSLKGGKRRVKQFYVGKDGALAVNTFCREKMPEHEWELDEEKLQNAVFFLNYHKGEETCEIRIEELPGDFWGKRTQMGVVIGTKE